MNLHDEFMQFLKIKGITRPKRGGPYRPRVQVVGKTDERTQIKVQCLAYEHLISTGELVDLLCHELIDDPRLLQRCLKRREESSWSKRTKYGHPEDYFQYPHMKQNRTAKEEAACQEVVNNPRHEPKPGSEQEKRLKKLAQIGKRNRARKQTPPASKGPR